LVAAAVGEGAGVPLGKTVAPGFPGVEVAVGGKGGFPIGVGMNVGGGGGAESSLAELPEVPAAMTA